jgi:hypothetical protein
MTSPAETESLPTEIAPLRPPATKLDDLVHRAAEYARDWAAFETWCAAKGLGPLPAAPATAGTYLASLAVATLSRRLAAISTMHRHAGHRLDRLIDREAVRYGHRLYSSRLLSKVWRLPLAIAVFPGHSAG